MNVSTYCCADLHGCRWAWEAIKNVLKPNDTLYFLGDAIDRGDDGWAIMKELLNDPRVIYIKGNHEDLMLQAIGNSSMQTFNPEAYYADEAMYIWYTNEGKPTHDAYLADPDRFKVIRQVRKLPYAAVYHNTNNEIVYLTHAGCNVHNFDKLTEEEALWDRSHFVINRWDGNYNEVVVHGHTPIALMVEEQDNFMAFYSDDDNFVKRNADMIEPGAYWYAGGHKINIDCGAVFTGVCVLLDLDTWNEQIFLEDEQ